MRKFFIMMLVNIRWAYFHIHPHYYKFKISSEGDSYFQNVKTGEMVHNFTWNDDVNDSEFILTERIKELESEVEKLKTVNTKLIALARFVSTTLNDNSHNNVVAKQLATELLDKIKGES